MDKKRQIIIEQAGEDSWSMVAELIRSVYRNMEHKEWFVIEEPESIKRQMECKKIKAYYAKDQVTNEIGAVFYVVYPDETDHLGIDLGMDEETMNRAIHMDTVAVKPSFRGCGLQSDMMLFAEKELAREGYTCFLATVHPDNKYSHESMERIGYTCVKTTKKYGGFLRDIMRKNL